MRTLLSGIEEKDWIWTVNKTFGRHGLGNSDLHVAHDPLDAQGICVKEACFSGDLVNVWNCSFWIHKKVSDYH